MKRCLLIPLLFAVYFSTAQDIRQRLEQEVKTLVADSQMRAAILGFYVADAQTGEEIFSWNGRTGLAPASTQKIITSVAAFELLGKDYRYTTEFWGGRPYEIKEGRKKITVLGDLFIRGHGDPTLGSWRYVSTKEETIADSLASAFRNYGIDELRAVLNCYQNKFEVLQTPGGWIVDDIGNYYGAGTAAVNWKENQFDVTLYPGINEGDPVSIGDSLYRDGYDIRYNALKTGKKGTGDNAYLYYDKQGQLIITGTAESASGKLTISGGADPYFFMGHRLSAVLRKVFPVAYDLRVDVWYDKELGIRNNINGTEPLPFQLLYTHYSPTMDSIIYWFMKRSINLYGEALIKTIAFEKTGVGSTDSGVAYVKNFYKEKGFDPASLKIIDGSGLSPQNRLTAEALCKAMLYAKQQDWFPAFRQSFPRYNEMNLKSGTIGGARSFAGYHTSADGKEYVVAIIVNNYDGGAIDRKMFRVLDVLK